MDKFYTNPKIATHCVNKLLKGGLPDKAVFLEPSAGNGAFYNPLNNAGLNVTGIDISPAFTSIHKQDFYDFDGDLWRNGCPLVTVGNPPFGKMSLEAIKFFNQAAKYSEIIAFILPKTFRKLSVIKKLDKNFHLYDDFDLPKNSFIKDGAVCDVPSCWQVWVRKKQQRIDPTPPTVSHLMLYTKPEFADFSLRRVGGRAGKVLEGTQYSASSTYFIKEVKNGIKGVLADIDWSVRDNTVGVRSISKPEIAFALNGAING
jgi:hypothetical protein